MTNISYRQVLNLVAGKQNRQLITLIEADPTLLQLGDGQCSGILIYSVQCKNHELADYLITHHRAGVQFELDKRSKNGYSILFHPAMLGDVESVRLLVEKAGFDIWNGNHAGTTLVDLAIEHSRFVYYLMQNKGWLSQWPRPATPAGIYRQESLQ